MVNPRYVPTEVVLAELADYTAIANFVRGRVDITTTGSISGSTVRGTNITGSQVSISGNLYVDGDISGSIISDNLTAVTVTGSSIVSGSSIYGATGKITNLTAVNVTGSTLVSGSIVAGATGTLTTVNSTNVNSTYVTGSSIISGSSVYGKDAILMNVTSTNITGSTLISGSVFRGPAATITTINGTNIYASSNMSGSTVQGQTGTLDTVNAVDFSGSSIVASDSGLHKAASYIIYSGSASGGPYFAENGSSGLIEFSGSNFGTVLNASIVSGSTVIVKEGKYSFSTARYFPGNATFEIGVALKDNLHLVIQKGATITQDDALKLEVLFGGNLSGTNNGVPLENVTIEVHGIIDGNYSNQSYTQPSSEFEACPIALYANNSSFPIVRAQNYGRYGALVLYSDAIHSPQNVDVGFVFGSGSFDVTHNQANALDLEHCDYITVGKVQGILLDGRVLQIPDGGSNIIVGEVLGKDCESTLLATTANVISLENLVINSIIGNGYLSGSTNQQVLINCSNAVPAKNIQIGEIIAKSGSSNGVSLFPSLTGSLTVNLQIGKIISYNNGRAGGTYSGVLVGDYADTISIGELISYDDKSSKTQVYGLNFENNVTNFLLRGGNISGNISGSVNNFSTPMGIIENVVGYATPLISGSAIQGQSAILDNLTGSQINTSGNVNVGGTTNIGNNTVNGAGYWIQLNNGGGQSTFALGSFLEIKATEYNFKNIPGTTTYASMISSGQLQLPVVGSGSGLLIGGDAQLYRSDANEITIPDDLVVTGSISGSTLQAQTGTVDNLTGSELSLSGNINVGGTTNIGNNTINGAGYSLQLNDGAGSGTLYCGTNFTTRAGNLIFSNSGNTAVYTRMTSTGSLINGNLTVTGSVSGSSVQVQSGTINNLSGVSAITGSGLNIYGPSGSLAFDEFYQTTSGSQVSGLFLRINITGSTYVIPVYAPS